MNADGSYWKPEQYPKTTWVAAKGPSVGPSTLSGFTCAIPIIIDESFDANYKLFKNQNGEVFARYIGTNCRNGPPMKKVWVPKKCLKNLPVNVVMTPQVKKTNPRLHASYGPKASYRQMTHLSRTNASVLQGNRTQAYEYERVSSNRHVHKTQNYSAYSYEYYSPPARLFARAPHILIPWASHMNSQPRTRHSRMASSNARTEHSLRWPERCLMNTSLQENSGLKPLILHAIQSTVFIFTSF